MRGPRLSLTGRFALLSAAALLVLGFALASVLGRVVRGQALDDARSTAALVARVAVQPRVTSLQLQRRIPTEKLDVLGRTIRVHDVLGQTIVGAAIWNRSRAPVYTSDTAPTATPAQLDQVLRGLELVSASKRTGVVQALVPLRYADASQPAGVFGLALPYAPLASSITRETHELTAMLAIGLVLLYGLLFRIVSGASRTLREQALQNRELALQDALTGMPNRTLFHDRLEQALARSRRKQAIGAVLIIDLDHFKEINDTLGHHAGDRLLCEVGTRIRAMLRESDTVARFGGDEFALLLPEVADAQGASLVAERIRAALALPMLLEGISVETEPSVGIALFPEHGTDPDLLLQRADVAMYQAKEQRLCHSVYSPDSDKHSPRRLALLSEVRTGLDQRDFHVLYHPIVEVGSGAVHRVEALIRWQHPVHGLVMPGEFIPLAERTGLIRPLTVYVLESALAQCARWQDAGIDVAVSVNLSARNLLDTSFPEEVGELLADHGLSGDKLQLEITENTLMSDPSRALLVLGRLRDLGVSLAIDDFGTGYSSLSYLTNLPVTELKIDRSFVMRMNEREGDRQIVRSTVALGKNLGLTVVAEGVETSAILDELQAVGCDQAQGFLFTKPLAPADFTAWWYGRSEARLEDAARSSS